MLYKDHQLTIRILSFLKYTTVALIIEPTGSKLTHTLLWHMWHSQMFLHWSRITKRCHPFDTTSYLE